jgi:hypothetical protein
MNEFFSALYTENDVGSGASGSGEGVYMTGPFGDLPLSSPDSITVTTEFGVLEETGNVTIISAGGVAHPYDSMDGDGAEYSADGNEDEYADEYGDEYQGPEYHHHDHESYVIHTEDTAQPHPAMSTDWVTAVALQHQQEQNIWLLQQQMQNLYNVNLGNNTTPPPTQHVAPVVYHQEGDIAEESEDDQGDEADVDTDSVLDEEEDGVEGTATPTVVAGALD